MKTFIIAEIGINHNGKLNKALDLMKVAKNAGCDAVKFQKRTIDKVYTKEELDKPREHPLSDDKTNRGQKIALEFGKPEYTAIDNYSQSLKLPWFASAWDLESQQFLQQFNCKYNKVASAMLTDLELLKMIASEGKYTFISTGMSTMDEIEDAVNVFISMDCPFELMHCNSQYPMPDEKANLRCIKTLSNYFNNCKVGYSGHEVGIITSVAAVALGATSIERHITLDRASYGSDQAASLEPQGLNKMVEYIRVVEKTIGDGIKRVTPEEEKCKAKLRKK